MARDITIPSLGVAMENALVVAWLKQEGDQVEADEPVVEIETDKSTMELVAPVSGQLGPHLYAEGALVAVGVVVAAVYPADSDPPAAPADGGHASITRPWTRRLPASSRARRVTALPRSGLPIARARARAGSQSRSAAHRRRLRLPQSRCRSGVGASAS